MEQTFEYKGYTVNIDLDEYPMNPIKEFDGNAKYCLFHRNYDLQNDTSLRKNNYSDWDDIEKAIIREYKPLAILPVYMYDHSSITISTKPFNCRWDSMQIGFVFVDKKTLNEWGFKSHIGYENSTGRTLEDDIRSNVNLYDSYLRGDVYRYTITDRFGNDLDTCSGYYGNEMEDLTKELKSIIDSYENFDKKDEIEKILIWKWSSIGMDIPSNYEDIVQYCYEDVNETADPENWNDGDVAIAFRRWIEEQ